MVCESNQWNMTTITPFILIAFGVALIGFGLYYLSRRHPTG
jgi:hypothetical protein